MKRFVLVLATSLALVVPASAGAHNSRGWYWSESRAESRLVQTYDDVYDAECYGYGKRHRGLYRHFICDTYDVDDYLVNEAGELHVKGRRGFVFYIDEDE